MLSCAVCKKPDKTQEPHPTCDSCNHAVCAICAELSATEARVFTLKKRKMKFFCYSCEPKLTEILDDNKNKVQDSSEIRLLYQQIIKDKDVIIEDKQKIVNILEEKICLMNERIADLNKQLKNAASPITLPRTGDRNKGKNKHRKRDERVETNTERAESYNTSSPGNQSGLTTDVLQTDGDDTAVDVACEGDMDAGWKYVQRKKRDRRTIHGTSVQVDDFAAVKRKAWFFIGRVRSEVTAEVIKSYISGKLPNEDVDCQKVETRSVSNCFRVGVDYEQKEILESEDFWPAGIRVQQYFFRRQSNPTSGGRRNQ